MEVDPFWATYAIVGAYFYGYAVGTLSKELGLMTVLLAALTGLLWPFFIVGAIVHLFWEGES